MKGEFIKLNHKVIAYYKTMDQIREENIQKRNNNGEKIENMPDIGNMSSQAQFFVYQKMNKGDFKKTNSVASVKVANLSKKSRSIC